MSAIKRRLALLIGATALVLALSAPLAHATEVFDSGTEEACAPVSPAVEPGAQPIPFVQGSYAYESGGCSVEVVAYSSIVGDWAFLPENYCSSSFEARVGPDGWGYLDNLAFYGCTYSTKPCAGDRVIAPSEYNPDLGDGKGLFKYANGDTELNVPICAEVTISGGGPVKLWGFVSFDIDEGPEGLQAWTNQQSVSPHGYWYWVSGGSWVDYSGGSLLISH